MQFLRRRYCIPRREVLFFFFHFVKKSWFSPSFSPWSLQDHKKEAILLAKNCRETHLTGNRNSPTCFHGWSRFPLTVKEDGDLVWRDSNFLAQNWLEILKLHRRKHNDVSDVDFPFPIEEDDRKRDPGVDLHHLTCRPRRIPSAENINKERLQQKGFYKRREAWWGFRPEIVIKLRRWGYLRNMNLIFMV